MRNWNIFKVILAVAIVCGTARADEVVIDDGSRLVGEVVDLADGALTLRTRFAGEVSIEGQHVVGIATDAAVNVELSDGRRVTGRLTYSPDAGQGIVGSELGDVNLTEATVVGLWRKSAPEASAEEAEAEQEGDESPAADDPARSARAEQIEQVIEESAEQAHPWTARLELGINGTTGNNERVAMHGRAEANRNTDDSRLNLFLEGRYARDNGVRSQNEIIGGVKLEVDLSEMWFAYGKVIAEHDEFENLHLRGTATAGLGRFLIKKEKHELKVFAGAGYQHESFMDGGSQDECIAEAGYDYRLDVMQYLRFKHSLTWYPTFSDPHHDYRLVSETSGEIPISGDTAWKIRIGMKNQYDAEPQPGIEKLDTWYFLNLVYDFK